MVLKSVLLSFSFYQLSLVWCISVDKEVELALKFNLLEPTWVGRMAWDLRSVFLVKLSGSILIDARIIER